MATGGNFFGNLFGGGGIQHNAGSAQVTELPHANPQQNLQQGQQGQQQPPAKNEEPVDPINSQLDKVRGIWNNATTADGKPLAPQADPLAQQMFQFDPSKVAESAGKLDFTGNISQETLEKVVGQNGDPAALKELLNSVVRQAFVASSLQTGHLLNDGFSRHGKNIDQALPARLRNIQVSQKGSEDSILSHASVKPLFTAMRGIVANNNPHASPDEVHAAAEAYFNQIGQAFLARERQASGKELDGTPVEQEVDWMKSFGL